MIIPFDGRGKERSSGDCLLVERDEAINDEAFAVEAANLLLNAIRK